MLKSLTIISLVAAALAQSSVPAGITPTCATFLTSLNADSDLAKCTNALSGALAAFSPGAANATSSTVTTALTNICGDSITSSCPSSTLTTKITNFSTDCVAELTTNRNADVVAIYDALYLVSPFVQAVCTKGDSGDWCASSVQTANGTSVQTIQNALYTQVDGNVVPNAGTFAANNIPYLLLQPTSPNLCSTCTRNILTAYINFESDVPYAVGLTNSLLLSTQSALYAAVTTQCGSSFMEGEVKAAGGLSSSNILGSSSGALPGAEFRGFVASFAGFATLAVTTLL